MNQKSNQPQAFIKRVTNKKRPKTGYKPKPSCCGGKKKTNKRSS
ncbi:Uncharacterised protein [Niallia circulans]|nr:Uncharacterised protein [Niallia circulans]